MNQLIISKSVISFKERMESIYDLKCVNEKGYDANKPTLFMGVYNTTDINRINNHKGNAVVLWCGADIASNVCLNRIRHDAKHIAISDSIWKRLNQYEISHSFIPACFVDLDFWKPVKLGNKVYCYAPNEKYGLSLAREIQKEIPYEMIITRNYREHSLSDIRDMYSQCFVGLRLRNWYDGNSATVQEMGLMGIRSIWNGENPAAIGWKNKEDIIKMIKLESLKIGTMQNELSKEVYECFDKSRKDILKLIERNKFSEKNIENI